MACMWTLRLNFMTCPLHKGWEFHCLQHRTALVDSIVSQLLNPWRLNCLANLSLSRNSWISERKAVESRGKPWKCGLLNFPQSPAVTIPGLSHSQKLHNGKKRMVHQNSCRVSNANDTSQKTPSSNKEEGSLRQTFAQTENE